MRLRTKPTGYTVILNRPPNTLMKGAAAVIMSSGSKLQCAICDEVVIVDEDNVHSQLQNGWPTCCGSAMILHRMQNVK